MKHYYKRLMKQHGGYIPFSVLSQQNLVNEQKKDHVVQKLVVVLSVNQNYPVLLDMQWGLFLGKELTYIN